MHVLNDEGVFASRYFPGVGGWMAPFVAWGKPTWGHFLAGLITAVAILGVGRELAGNGVGLLAGLLTAAAPGMALFSNLLLSHHPALAGLSVFVYGFLRMQRSGTAVFGLVAGFGLTLAMLCRPLTAAAMGLPFGCWLAWWWIRGGDDISADRRRRHVACVGVPVLLGMAVMGWYNHQLTGDWATTPYRVFTDKHTPRHIFGFDNVVHGEQRIAEMDAASRERVLEHYDRWAENLDGELAVRNVVSRVIESGEVDRGTGHAVDDLGGAVGRLPVRGVAVARTALAADRAGHRLPAPGSRSILVRGDHELALRVREWPVLVPAGGRCDSGVVAGGRRVGRPGLALAWSGLLLVSPVTSYQSFEPVWSPSRIGLAVGEVGFARKKHEEFRSLVRQRVKEDRALVLVDPDPADRHIDFVVNEPTLDAAVLVGRYVPKVVPLSKVLGAFPQRRVFVFEAQTGRLREVRR
ncbi:MAG: hypothetical protein CM1200mP2_01070 [Planctomycetaceae bacterium]|nr:MAG: hypothetical protein CM1200mP2_01070 [Planctomycetaceae bacterium]